MRLTLRNETKISLHPSQIADTTDAIGGGTLIHLRGILIKESQQILKDKIKRHEKSPH